jgi:hypothetical protein
MVVTSYDGEDIESSVHVVEAHLEVPTRMIVHSKSGVLVSDLWVIETEKSFKEHN